MASSSKQVAKFAADSAFVFVGTVVQPRAAMMEGVASDATAIVQVDQVVAAPPMFTAMAGHRVTVRFKKPPVLRKGSRLTFFTNGWIFGTSIAVDVVGTAEVAGSQAMATAVRSAHATGSDAALSARIASAAMGVVGTVAQVSKADKGPTHISEHDPNWHEATIAVDEVLKGKKGVKQVTVLFPNSDDVRWHKTAKYAAGQQGIWMLQKGSTQDAKGIPAKVFAAIPGGADVMTALHPGDFLPLHELERVRALVQAE